MSYTKNYYDILGLAPPSSFPSSSASRSRNASAGSEQENEQEQWQEAVKKAYRAALLGAHPDTTTSSSRGQARSNGGADGRNEKGNNREKMDKETGREKGKVTYTVDDVKEAFAVLGDGEKRAEYDGWLARVGNAAAVGMGGKGAGDGDGFLLGLEVLDLSDFEAGGCWVPLGSAPGTPGSVGGDAGGDEVEGVRGERGGQGEKKQDEGEKGDGQEGRDKSEQEEDGDLARDSAAAGIGGALIEWTRPCRCGAEKGYRIQEKELEDAEERGETEVLVGCEGCSLWVRVGFEVQEG